MGNASRIPWRAVVALAAVAGCSDDSANGVGAPIDGGGARAGASGSPATGGASGAGTGTGGAAGATSQTGGAGATAAGGSGAGGATGGGGTTAATGGAPGPGGAPAARCTQNQNCDSGFACYTGLSPAPAGGYCARRLSATCSPTAGSGCPCLDITAKNDHGCEGILGGFCTGSDDPQASWYCKAPP